MIFRRASRYLAPLPGLLTALLYAADQKNYCPAPEYTANQQTVPFAGVVYYNGSPIENISVACRRGSRLVGLATRTGPDGRFRIDKIHDGEVIDSVEAIGRLDQNTLLITTFNKNPMPLRVNWGRSYLCGPPAITVEPRQNPTTPAAPLNRELNLNVIPISFKNPVSMRTGQNASTAPAPHSQSVPILILTVRDKDEIINHASISVRELKFPKGQNGVEPTRAPALVARDIMVNVNGGTLRYVFPHPGMYLVSVSASGHIPELIAISAEPTGVSVKNSAGTDVDYDLTLDKTDAGSGVSVDSPMQGVNVGSRDLMFTSALADLLPLRDWRSPDELAYLAPGIAPAPIPLAPLLPGVTPGFGSAGEFSDNGLRGRDNNFSVDGSDDNDEEIGARRQGFIAQFPQPIESLEEFHIITALADASYGRGIAAQVEAVTKSVHSNVHSQIWGFATGGHLVAKNFFDVTPTSYPSAFRRQLPITANGALNGPLVQFNVQGSSIPFPYQVVDGVGYQSNPAAEDDKLFRDQAGFFIESPIGSKGTSFAVSYERRTRREEQKANFAVPTPEQRQICTGTTNASCVPGSTLGLFPASLRGDAFWSLYPFPNNPLGPYGPNTFTEELPEDANGNLYMVQLTQSFPTGPFRHSFTARYNDTNESSILPQVGDSLFSSVEPLISTLNVASFLNTVFSPSMANTVRLSYGRTRSAFNPLRNAFLSPSTKSPSDLWLLNAPLLLNITTAGSASPIYTPGDSTYGKYLLNLPGVSAFYGPQLQSQKGATAMWADQIDEAYAGQITMGGFSSIGTDVYEFPQQRSNGTWESGDTMTEVAGRHTFNFGFDIRRVQLDSTVERDANPIVNFNGVFDVYDGTRTLLSSTSLASIGTPTATIRTFALISNGVEPDYSLELRATQAEYFFQDEFVVRPRFHLLAGVRLQDARLPQDISGHFQQAFDRNSILQSANQECPPTKDCATLIPVLSALLPSSFQAALNPRPLSVDGRFGLAWDLFGDGGTLLRGGWGQYTGQFPAVLVDEARNAFPSFLTISGAPTSSFATRNLPGTNGIISGSPINALLLLSQNFPGNNLSADLTYPAPGLRNPLSRQLNVTLEQRLTASARIDVAYVATWGDRLLDETTPLGGPQRNAFDYPICAYPFIGNVPPHGCPKPDGPFPMPQGTGMFAQSPIGRTAKFPGWSISPLLLGDQASSSYHSLQATITHKFTNALQMRTAFTWSHAIDNASDFENMAGAFGLPQDSFNPSERASSNFDIRIMSTSEFIFDSSTVTGFKPLRGWLLSGILTLHSAQPYTINTSFDVNMDGNMTDRLNTTNYLVSGSDPRTKVQLQLPQGLGTQVLLASPGQNGSVGRNTFQAWGMYDLDLALGRNFTLFTQQLQARVEGYNVFNHPNFGIPVRILEAPAFGSAVNTIVPPRIVQFALKYVF